MKTFFISAGEASGDLHASALLKALQARTSGLRFFGLGGEMLKSLGVELLFEVGDLAVTGFWEVAKRIAHFRHVFNTTLAEIDKRKPELAIFVDYPGFNLRMAQECRKRGIKNIYYIVPQVWAWKKNRIQQIERVVDLLLAILPFEKSLFDPQKIQCEFVGHPLLDVVDSSHQDGTFRNSLGLENGERMIALLPGSRSTEVGKHYETMLRAVTEIQRIGISARAFTAVRSELDPALYADPESAVGVKAEHIAENRYDLLGSTDVSIVSSGTATLEAALCGRPFCVVYKTGWLTYQIARRIIKLNNVGLVNIVAGKQIVPEYLQSRMTPRNLADFCTKVFAESDYRQEMINSLATIRTRLGQPGASERAAGFIGERFLK